MHKCSGVLVKVFLILTLHVAMFGGVYEENCLACHKNLPVKIDKFFYRYLLKYSSEENLKNALKSYLKNPSRKKSVLQEELLDRFGVKKPTTLNSDELKEAIDKYWEIYKVFGKLK